MYFENKLKLQVCLGDFQEKFKEVVNEYWDVIF